MSSYNDWNGEPISGSYYFLTELLRQQYGFNGYVVSDSEAVELMHSKHRVTSTYEETAKLVLEAGLNVRTNFSQPHTFINPVRSAYQKGMLSMETIDQRVREVLSVKFRLGLFDNPYTGDGPQADREAGFDRHVDFSDEVQSQGIVLLKNAPLGESPLLPLDKSRIGKMLFGEINPSGKLPITFPKSIGEVEFNFPYKRGSHNGPAWYKRGTRVNGALYPFGYGIGSSSFDYADMHVDVEGEDITVTAKITNTGKYDGEEVAQLYFSDLITSVVSYESQLRGFERVALKAGETKTVTFKLKRSDLQLLDKDMHWSVEPGEFEFRVGASSEDVRLKQTILLSPDSNHGEAVQGVGRETDRFVVPK